MKEINSLQSLQKALDTHGELWLLLYKKGSTQSDCAFENYEEVIEESNESLFFAADVNSVKDIHAAFGITSVPTFIKFENGALKRLIKGCLQTGQLKAAINGSTFVSNSEKGNKAQKNVVVYTTPTCSWCTAVKRHFDAYGISYREINVAADTKAAENMVKRSGQQGVPQTEINGQIVVGFDKTKINSLLGIN